MRLQNKYKKFSKLAINFKEFPTKLLKFHRTKWKKLQQIISKKKTIKKQLWSTKVLLPTKKWISYRAKYSTGVKLKKYFDCLFDKAFSILFFKKLKFLNTKLDKTTEHSIYLIRPEFRVDIFFWRLNFFSSCYEARQAANNKKIKVNNRSIHPNYFLKKGDIITFDSLNYHMKAFFKNFLEKKLNNSKFLTFIEIDYYTNTVIILKDYTEFTEKDITLFTSTFGEITKFKTFIE